MRAVIWHSGSEVVDLSHTMGTFLINDVLNVILSEVFRKEIFFLEKMDLFQLIAHTSKGQPQLNFVKWYTNRYLIEIDHWFGSNSAATV